jgi:TM2 domain-containing membrane protein YozV
MKSGKRIAKPTPKPRAKANITAIILSALFPGAGQLYNGDRAKGVLFLLLWFIVELVFNIVPESYWDITRGEVDVDLSLYLRLALLGGFRIAVVIDADRGGKRLSSEEKVET